MIITRNNFVIVYNVMSKHRRNATSRTVYKNCPKTIKNKTEAIMYYHSVVDGKTPHIHKRLVEIRG